MNGYLREIAVRFQFRHGDRPLDGYTIRRGIGCGRFGEVYFAVSDGGREVALKTVLENPDIELRGVGHCINLKSPNLVSVFDLRKGVDGTPFVIMEYVTGPSFRDILKERPAGLGAAEVGFLAREMAKGLAELHRHDIVHRDLKPENIFFEDGLVKIGDYGLAKFINTSHRSIQTISVGTVHYMAPEIGSGTYEKSIDIYAFGVILYELFTGEVPFQGDSFGEVLMKHLTAEADLSGIEEPLRSAIAGALEKKPEKRFESVESMVDGLFRDKAFDTRVSTFRPVSLSEVAERHRGRNRADNEEVVRPPPLPERGAGDPDDVKERLQEAGEAVATAAAAAEDSAHLKRIWATLVAAALSIWRFFVRMIVGVPIEEEYR